MEPKPIQLHHRKFSPWQYNMIRKKPGRPRAIPKSLEPEIIKMYREQALGYRAIERELRKIGLNVSWQTVRRLIKDRLDENLDYRPIHCTLKRTRE